MLFGGMFCRIFIFLGPVLVLETYKSNFIIKMRGNVSILNILQSELNLVIWIKKYNFFSKGQLFVKMSQNVLFLSLCMGLFAYLTSILSSSALILHTFYHFPSPYDFLLRKNELGSQKFFGKQIQTPRISLRPVMHFVQDESFGPDESVFNWAAGEYAGRIKLCQTVDGHSDEWVGGSA